jgi:hypothetical protein
MTGGQTTDFPAAPEWSSSGVVVCPSLASTVETADCL